MATNNQAMTTLQPISPAVAPTFKAVRLRALLDTPTAFGSTHAKEVQLSDSDWQRRAVQWNGERSIGYIAITDQEPCGIVASFLDEADTAKAHLVSMWVAPAYRKLGIGRQLVQAIMEWARSKGAHTVCLMVTSSNDAAIGFYERLGFAKTGRTEPYLNDSTLVECEMHLDCRSAGN